VPTAAELREEPFPLQLAPELLQGALHAVALTELDLCHCIPPEKDAADPPDGEPAASDRDGLVRDPDYCGSLTTFSAAGPFWPCTMSNSTRSPSARLLKP
jgi:hypothetical protein